MMKTTKNIHAWSEHSLWSRRRQTYSELFFLVLLLLDIRWAQSV
jgi:hypothetical protein